MLNVNTAKNLLLIRGVYINNLASEYIDVSRNNLQLMHMQQENLCLDMIYYYDDYHHPFIHFHLYAKYVQVFNCNRPCCRCRRCNSCMEADDVYFSPLL